VSIGDTLAAARRQAGLTVTQVSQRTCIRETIVRGIERGDYSACGGDFYARGHIRSIARSVGLDPEELIREYDATEAPPHPITAADVFQPFTPVKLKERRRTNWSVVLLVGVVAVLAAVGFGYWSHKNNPAKTDAAQPPAHKIVKPSVSPAAHAAPHGIRITLVPSAGSVTWAELTLASGKVIFEGDVAGTTKTWSEKNGAVTLSLGNPGGATVYLNGKKQKTETTQPVTLNCTKVHCVAG
jgi:transcriptional regulator with XRE-family HTH domain